MSGCLGRTSTRFVVPLVAMLVVAVSAAGCRRITKPNGWADPVIAGNVVVATTRAGELSAIRKDDWKVLWRFPESQRDRAHVQAIYGTPVVTADTVYFGGYDGNVYALNMQTGTPKWEQPFQTGDRIVGGVVLDEASSTLFVGSEDSRVYALDPRNGKVRSPWDFKAGAGIWATPLLADETLYIPSLDRNLYAVRTTTGEEIWRFNTNEKLLSSPVLFGHTIIVGGMGSKLYAIDVGTGAEIWSFKGKNWFWGEPLLDGDTVYAPSLDHHIYAIDLATGSQRWSFNGLEPIRSRPLLTTDGVLITADAGGNIYGLDARSGNTAWAAPAIAGSAVLSDPILDGEQILISGQGGRLLFLDPKAATVIEVPLK